MTVAIIGSNGQLGSDLCRQFKKTGDMIFELTHDQIEIADFPSVQLCLEKVNPDIVINTAAMHNVEACEKDPALAFAVNAIGAKNLSIVSNEQDFVLVHISTDYVFNGDQSTPYKESDLPCPINTYGNTKLSGEFYVRSLSKKYFIIRTSGLYGSNPCRAKGGDNFVRLMLKLADKGQKIKVVDDEIVTPTYTINLAEQIVKLSESHHYGLYHITAQESCSWYHFAKKIFEISKLKPDLNIAEPGEFANKIPRPKYSVLDNYNLKKIKMDTMPHWAEGLRKYMKELHLT
jgi:dTDP-4-dehydrorhamnose reductase